MIEVKINSAFFKYIAFLDHTNKNLLQKVYPSDKSDYFAWSHKDADHLITLIWWNE